MINYAFNHLDFKDNSKNNSEKNSNNNFESKTQLQK